MNLVMMVMQKERKKIYERFFKPLQEGFSKFKNMDISYIISGDHSTPCIKKAHTDDPIPLLISGKNIANDGTSRLTESYSRSGAIGKILGYEVIDCSLKVINSK
jgi:2,3-bisphosphoglycerate-independent phosphoglycerate mutase